MGGVEGGDDWAEKPPLVCAWVLGDDGWTLRR
jgi:hypothetical protein